MTTNENTPVKKDTMAGSSSIGKETPKKKPFWKKHFLSLFLFVLLIISAAWGYFANRAMESKYEKEITALTQEHDAEIERIKVENIKQLSNTLALAVRSEMIAENMNQVNQYFLQTLKTFDVEKVMLVDHNTSVALLSTNKKDENTNFGDPGLVNAKEAMTKMYNNHHYAATPIMGLNTQLGVLIIQVD